MLFNKDFSIFAQTLGKLSLGVDDTLMEKIGRLYWYSVEFGLYKDGNDLKAYGAGILSSYGELEYCQSDKCTAKFVDFNPDVISNIDYPITTYQEMYCIASSFKDATDRIYKFINKKSTK
jgi:phenylalanine-4-hydroxylase